MAVELLQVLQQVSSNMIHLLLVHASMPHKIHSQQLDQTESDSHFHYSLITETANNIDLELKL